MSNYHWQTDELNVCVYKEGNVPNSYYVWTKIAVQSWRQALRDYNDSDIHDRSTWSITARYTGSEFPGDCNIKVYIYDSYKDFPGYPEQTGAYTAVEYNEKGIVTNAAVYLSPIVLHGVENIDIDLPSHAFRNSASHELGHIFGLGHMKSETVYLMSPRFDFWEEKDVMPITTLELSTLRSIYGSNGWSE